MSAQGPTWREIFRRNQTTILVLSIGTLLFSCCVCGTLVLAAQNGGFNNPLQPTATTNLGAQLAQQATNSAINATATADASSGGPANATATHTPKPVATATRVPPTATPKPQAPPPTATPCADPCNPWGYNFSPGNLIYNPPSAFCDYFNCIASFWNGRGYVEECQDLTFSKSGGISGSCSHHGGDYRPLYSH